MAALSARTEQLVCLGAETQATAFSSPPRCHLHVELSDKQEITHFTQSKGQKWQTRFQLNLSDELCK